MGIVVFTDLDGTLLDHDTYAHAAAAPALAELKKRHIPLVLASGKTAAEIEPLHAELDLGDTPAIVENGAGIFDPSAPANLADDAYRQIRRALADPPPDLADRFRGVGDMDAAEVARALDASVTIALGDAPNDTEMLQAADFGVRMRNDHAPPIPRLEAEARGRILRTRAAGPEGWNEAVPELLKEIGGTFGQQPWGDFHQNGNIVQFHDLRSRPVEEVEYDLETFSQSRTITLILPSLYSELSGPALRGILSELVGPRYILRIIIGLDKADETEFRKARDFISALPQDHVVIWNGGDGMRAFHDCDILTYKREMLSRLLKPVANPNFYYQLSKGLYARIGDTSFDGRVSWLLVRPLLIALKKVAGDHGYLDYLRSFRNALSGEFALRITMLPNLRTPSDWALEIGELPEAWRNLGRNTVCQVAD